MIYDVTKQEKRDGPWVIVALGLGYWEAQKVLDKLRREVGQNKIWDCGLKKGCSQVEED